MPSGMPQDSEAVLSWLSASERVMQSVVVRTATDLVGVGVLETVAGELEAKGAFLQAALRLVSAAHSSELAHIASLDDVSPIMLDKIVHFFTYYKALEPNKWVKVEGWKDQAAAHEEIQSGVTNFSVD